MFNLKIHVLTLVLARVITLFWVLPSHTASLGVSGCFRVGFSKKKALHLSYLDAPLLHIMISIPLKGVEHHNQLPVTEMVMYMTDISSLNILTPVIYRVLIAALVVSSLIHNLVLHN